MQLILPDDNSRYVSKCLNHKAQIPSNLSEFTIDARYKVCNTYLIRWLCHPLLRYPTKQEVMSAMSTDSSTKPSAAASLLHFG